MTPSSMPVAQSAALHRPRDRDLLDRALTRTGGAALVEGNRVALLKDGPENYSAWLAAIRGARRFIHFENYQFRDDDIGGEIADALAARARDGVQVRLICDWVGSLGQLSRQLRRRLIEAGVDVRIFNPPRFLEPLRSLQRDHRKMVAVDARVGFITGVCVGDAWRGDPERGIEPWRDTGIELHGPAVADIEAAFAEVWAATGPPLPGTERIAREAVPRAGDVAVRIVASAPGAGSLLRLDQIVAAAARRTLWLTDAYFAGIPPYVQALRSAALDGVDVRLLVPGASDIPALRPLSRAGYGSLLEAGVRVFEWKGPMLHAKTAVADGCWSRVGSSNLNVASWIANYELDAVVEDEAFAAEMERMYLEDLENSTEVVLRRRRRRIVAPWRRRAEHHAAEAPREAPRRHRLRGSASRAAAGALRLGRTVGAALTEQRVLAQPEARVVGVFGLVLLALAAAALLWPQLAAIPAALLLLWAGCALLARAHARWRARRTRNLQAGPADP